MELTISIILGFMIIGAIYALHAKDLLSAVIAMGIVGYGLVICFLLGACSGAFSPPKPKASLSMTISISFGQVGPAWWSGNPVLKRLAGLTRTFLPIRRRSICVGGCATREERLATFTVRRSYTWAVVRFLRPIPGKPTSTFATHFCCCIKTLRDQKCI